MLHLGADSFLLDWPLCGRGLVMQKKKKKYKKKGLICAKHAQREVIKVDSLVKMVKNPPSVSSSLNPCPAE